MIGALVFLGLIIYTLSRSSEDFVNPFWEKFVFTTFLACAFLCLRNSFEPILGQSPKWAAQWIKLDGPKPSVHFRPDSTVWTNKKFFNSFSYAWMQYRRNLSFLWSSGLHWNCYLDHWKFSPMGLLLFLLSTNNTICLYRHHRCTRVSWTRPSRLISGLAYSSCNKTFRVICTSISLMKAFALPKYRHLRGILFLVFGLCGIAPCFHSTFFHGIEYSFSKEMFIRVYQTCPHCGKSERSCNEHGQGPNAKFDIDGCSLLYWSCFLHN